MILLYVRKLSIELLHKQCNLLNIYIMMN